ncbi:beta-ketoacyl-ACP synthase II [Paremcibacter congregatus]|uniref:3-oxoacyl-[acyl-carrier-protein] synthase 2 n=1 Tax=Paremcibacter congregatus TaxID=2043170 RepID=A0A2G4YUS2_9PROT|nr:beta-ketoacyl-ACP synthase II [Paremcibacter congregatus]PHZ86092.1 beta-ketoacyl-[acyl-carrier-protein] synthase II [Paremcibacter congregatus]QDE27058.1 beta-ketoacyl-ACP synthase II [Paremcibacter congregatus]
MRRVVVTGMGLVTPLASGVEETWKRLIAGESGAGPITRFDSTGLSAQVACEVPLGDGTNGTFNPDDWMTDRERRRIDDFILYGIAAAEMALKDAGWKPESDEDQWRTGILTGAGIGGLPGIQNESINMHERGVRRVSPHFIPRCLINLISGNVSIRNGLKGPNHAVVTACATGTHAVGDAARMIALDDADVMVAGGGEAAICQIGVAGFAQAKALSTHFNDTPERASRPYDRDRDGFVIGEGAGMLILEEYEHAKKRGAKIYAEVVGYGLSGDAYHVTAPAPDGSGGYRAMQAAFKRAGFGPEEIGYVNAHGTSTPLGDEIEFSAVKRLFGDAASQVAMSSTKSSIGHLLGAAGSTEAIFSILAMNRGELPPTLNLDNPSEGISGINLVPHEAQQKTGIKAVLSNSFGFGGTNASVIFKAV